MAVFSDHPPSTSHHILILADRHSYGMSKNTAILHKLLGKK